MNQPTMRILSLGAGVQSSTLALMAASGELPGLDAAIFANTGWEPSAVYEQVLRLKDELNNANVPLHVVSHGDIRTTTLDPTARFASLPWFIKHPDGSKGMARRQCTGFYKLEPLLKKVRELLGANPPDYRRVPTGRLAEQWIGFSTDEVHRANDRQENLYTIKRFPLLELGMSRKDCLRWLNKRGWGHTTKSACVGCPLHGNKAWRDLRDNRPVEWAQAVAFDALIRKGGANKRGGELRGEAYLHSSCLPLDQAPIDRWTRNEYGELQGDLFDLLEDGDPDGCSPYGCRSGEPVNLNTPEIPA